MYVPEDDGENSDEGSNSVHGLDMRTGANQDDCLPPLLRLEMYAMSDNMYNRQMVGRVALETLRAVADTPEDIRAAMDIINRAATDTEISVKAELMEQLPHIAMVCYEEREKLHFVVEECLLPLVIRFLGDSDNQMRKTTQAALLVLMEQGLVDMRDVEQQVCPAILMLTEVDNLVEFHTGAVALMSKMAPLLGAEATERLFMHRFAALCSLPVFYVRKVCANNFGDFCAVVGTAATEEFLLPYFVELCTDGIWGVRKACAEIFTTVAIHCTIQTRKDTLAPVFNNLLLDQSRWVRMSAFRALGQFIATFVTSGACNMQLNQHGDLVIPHDDSRLNMRSSNEGGYVSRTISEEKTTSPACNQPCYFLKESVPVVDEDGPSAVSNSNCYVCMQPDRISLIDNSKESVINILCRGEGDKKIKTKTKFSTDMLPSSAHNCNNSMQENQRECSSERDKNSGRKETDIYQDFNTFQFWRVPIPELDLSVGAEETLNRQSPAAEDNSKPDTFALKSDISATVKNELDSLASRLEQGFLNDSETVDPRTANVTICTDDQQIETDSEPIYLESARHHANDNVKTKFKRPEILGNMKQSVLSEKTCTSNKNAATLNQKSNVSHSEGTRKESDASHTDLDLSDSEEDNVLTIASQKSSGLYEVQKQVPSFVSLPRTSNSQKNSPVLYHEQKFLTSYSEQMRATYLEREQKYCVLYNEVGYLSACLEESDAPNPVVNCLLQSDVPSNRPPQDVVPHYLVDHFVSMTHPSQAQNTDNEITHHCAFSIPAVALTLGRNNWYLIKPAYEALASDVQWKVRRTVAASIHELAVILGEELAGVDLVPIFHGFIKDLDEVRIGALKHLAEFLKLLRPTERSTLLHRLSDFHLTDNECNWRFRSKLAEQLHHSLVLFAPGDTHEHITPLAIALLMDKVAAVRKKALCLVTQLVHHVSTEVNLVRSLLAELAEQFAHNKHWNRRQTFALLCSQLMSKRVLKDEHFACDVFPHLLELSWDPVPNVRLSVAQTLACDIAVQLYFSSSESPHNEMLIQCLRRLQGDDDKDVQYFASLYSIPSTTLLLEPSCDVDQ
ncbi:hypothetical protein R5R35_004991 [Gryllus longicercus]